MKVDKPETVKDKAALFDIFRRVENCLREDSEPGLPRFFEFANLLFVKLMDERQKEPLWKEPFRASLKAERNKIDYLNGFIIPALQTKYDAKDVFAETRITNETVVKKIVAILDPYHLTSFDSDILGDGYEYFLKENVASKQSLGQYFTPRHIARILVALVAPASNDTVYDPFCGTGGLLMEAYNAVREIDPSKSASLFCGRDASVSARVAKMNAILHWGDHSGIEQVTNTLAHPVHEKYSVGLTNVPFARDLKNYPYNELYENGLARKKTDVLSILHLFQSIRQGGKLVAIVPEGFLYGVERKAARKFLTDNADLRLVASLPHGVFLPYTGVKTAIIFLDNIRCPTRQSHFWYFDVESDGWTLDKRRERVEGRNGLDVLRSANLNKASQEDLTSRGFIKVPFEKVRQNSENWIGKHYQDSGAARSQYPLVPLGKLVTFVSTGFSYKAGQLSDDGIPLFTPKAVKKEFFPRCETKYLKYEIRTDEKSACMKGDILLTIKDKNKELAILGRATIANRNGVFSSDLVKVKVESENLLSAEYLYYCFRDDHYIKEIQKFSVGSIVKSISLENIASIKIPLPPLTMQKQIVADFNHYQKLINAQNEAANALQEKCRERLSALWG